MRVTAMLVQKRASRQPIGESSGSCGAGSDLMVYDRSRPFSCYHKRALSAIDPDLTAGASPHCSQINSSYRGLRGMRSQENTPSHQLHVKQE